MQKEEWRIQYGWGELLQTARAKAGLSQNKLASELEVPKACISNWEHERKTPSTRQLHSLFTALRMTSEEREWFLARVRK